MILARDLSPAEFKLVAPYRPLGDQPRAIEELTDALKRGDRYQTLLGVTGSGKTFTMANVIQAAARPTLVISHNKKDSRTFEFTVRCEPEKPLTVAYTIRTRFP